MDVAQSTTLIAAHDHDQEIGSHYLDPSVMPGLKGEAFVSVASDQHVNSEPIR